MAFQYFSLKGIIFSVFFWSFSRRARISTPKLCGFSPVSLADVSSCKTEATVESWRTLLLVHRAADRPHAGCHSVLQSERVNAPACLPMYVYISGSFMSACSTSLSFFFFFFLFSHPRPAWLTIDRLSDHVVSLTSPSVFTENSATCPQTDFTFTLRVDTFKSAYHKRKNRIGGKLFLCIA